MSKEKLKWCGLMINLLPFNSSHKNQMSTKNDIKDNDADMRAPYHYTTKVCTCIKITIKISSLRSKM